MEPGCLFLARFHCVEQALPTIELCSLTPQPLSILFMAFDGGLVEHRGLTMRAGFVTGAVISSHGLTVQAQHCRVPVRGTTFAGRAVQRRVRTQPCSAYTPRAAAASCVEVSEDSFESEVLLSVCAKQLQYLTLLHPCV
jgi:hypothetical protein